MISQYVMRLILPLFALHAVGADRAGTLTTAQIYVEKSRSYSFGNLLDAI